jgi:hypothetical protein
MGGWRAGAGKCSQRVGRGTRGGGGHKRAPLSRTTANKLIYCRTRTTSTNLNSCRELLTLPLLLLRSFSPKKGQMARSPSSFVTNSASAAPSVLLLHHLLLFGAVVLSTCCAQERTSSGGGIYMTYASVNLSGCVANVLLMFC